MKPVTGLPLLAVEIGGVPIDPDETLALTRLRVQQRLSVPSLCELAWESPGGELGRRGVPMGAPLTVRIGRAGPPLFEGEVTAAELAYGPSRGRELRVRGYDALHRLRKRQPVRAHVQVTVAGLARELTAGLGLRVVAAEEGPLSPWIVQWRESDLELLAGLAARAGLYLSLRGDALHLLTLEGLDEPFPLTAGEEIVECEVEVNAEPACREVAASGWDLHGVEHHEARASRARAGRSVRAEAPPSLFGATGSRTRAHQLATTAAQVEGAAQAELDRRVAREVVLRGTAEGDARLRPGARVELRGVAPEVAGVYVVTSATHVVDARRGWLAEISSAPPEGPAGVDPTGFTVGEVSRVDAASGRVKVALAAFGGVESDWLQVVSAGAGAGKGLAMLPDAGDRVAVIFGHGDPGEALVLGGLYGAAGPYDAGVDGAGVRRFTLRTAGGQVLRFDDGNRSIRIEDAAGSFVELSPEAVRLRSGAPLLIEAPGQPVTILGKTVDFKRG